MIKTAFLFPGQGSQVAGMGKDFYERSARAREIFEKADEVLGFKISELCFESPEERLKMTEVTQPALLVVSFIAYTLLDVKPDIGAGHSLGEYSALVAAGSIRFEDALLLVHKRGKYMQEAVPAGVGTMAAVLGTSYQAVEEALARVEEGIVDVANWNSQEQVVIAGDKEAVNEALEIIKPRRSVLLPVSAPFHCRLMRSAEEKLSLDLDRVEFKNLIFPIVTNVDAKVIHTGEEARDALKRQVSRPVLWYKTMEILRDREFYSFVELGSGKVLSGLARRISRSWPSQITVLNVDSMDTMKKAQEMFSGAL